MRWVLDGTKWHVTSGDVADFFLLHAHVDGDPAKATVFLVDKDLPGVRLVRTPKYSHTFVFEHPIFAFEGVRVGLDAVLGEVGAGYELTKDWFVEERIMIGARTVGAATRALDLSLDVRQGAGPVRRADRRVPGRRVHARGHGRADHGGEVDAVPGRLAGGAWRRRSQGAARARVGVKLVCSETAGRVADAAVQIHGGRGYMREQPVERLWRELRVDRIWEGTSEIQRMVIGNELRKRGPRRLHGMAVLTVLRVGPGRARVRSQAPRERRSGRRTTWATIAVGRRRRRDQDPVRGHARRAGRRAVTG